MKNTEQPAEFGFHLNNEHHLIQVYPRRILIPKVKFNCASCVLSATLSSVVERARIAVEFGTTSKSLAGEEQTHQGVDHVVQSGEVAAPKARQADARGASEAGLNGTLLEPGLAVGRQACSLCWILPRR